MNWENFSLLDDLIEKIVNKSIISITNRVKSELFFSAAVNILLNLIYDHNRCRD